MAAVLALLEKFFIDFIFNKVIMAIINVLRKKPEPKLPIKDIEDK